MTEQVEQVHFTLKHQTVSDILFNQLFGVMDRNKSQKFSPLTDLVLSSNVPLLETLLSFFSMNFIMPICECALREGHQEEVFRLGITKFFFQKYFNRVDRGMYFLHFQDPNFLQIQRNANSALGLRIFRRLQTICSYNSTLLNEIVTITAIPELLVTVESLFFEPQLPLPGMKKETIAMYCESQYQEYLALLRAQPPEIPSYLDPPLEFLREKIFEQACIEMEVEDKKKIKIVRYCGHTVRRQNLNDLLIQGFYSHNLIVMLLALANNYIMGVSAIVMELHDPFLRLVELSLRSSIFRSIALGVQDQFGFLFTHYDAMAQEILGSSFGPKYSFVFSSMSMWVQQMNFAHDLVQPALGYISAKLRETNLAAYFKEKEHECPSIYSVVRTQVQLQAFSNRKKVEAYSETQGKIDMQDFFYQNLEVYEVLAKDFLQYMVDISVNQINVHYCGHSQHTILAQPQYRAYSSLMCSSSRDYYQFILQTLIDCYPVDLRISMLRDILKEDLKYIENRIVKPVDLVIIMEEVEDILKRQLQKIPEFSIFTEEGLKKYQIALDFVSKDKLLDYFGCKLMIPKECEAKDSPFFNLFKNKSPIQILASVSMQDVESEELSEPYQSSEDQEVQIPCTSPQKKKIEDKTVQCQGSKMEESEETIQNSNGDDLK